MKQILALMLGILIFSPGTYCQVISDFETDIESWYSEGDGDYEWELGTGNPGNNFRVNDDATGDINLSYAPPKFLGNWSNATVTDYISMDLYLNYINGPYSTSNYVFQIEGPGGIARALEGTDPPYYIWTTYTVTLDPANWNILEGTWNGILQQVNEVIVRMEYINGDEWNRSDNIYLSFTPVVIPVEPVICSDFEEDGYDGWQFSNTGSISNQSTGGNPGRYIRISDGTGVSLANCPPKFLGDWTMLDNHAAEIQTDINIISGTGNTFLHDFFIKLEGPGGEAIFPIDNGIDNARGQWYTFAFPIQESSWTINSGTWANLINNVQSLTLVVEYIDGSETVGLDNFCITNLPPEADFEAYPLVAFPGYPIQFNDLSLHAPALWDWDFGDSQSSSEKNPQHSFLNPGVYNISLTSTNHFGSDNEDKSSYIEILDDNQCVKFEDNFDDATLAPIWEWGLVNGTWVENSGILRQISNYYISDNYLGACYALIGSPLWQDYVLSCDFKSTDDDAIGFVFNYQDGQNMYMFLWRNQTNERKLFRWDNGVSTVLAEDAVPYLQNQWYNAEISSIAGNLIVRINGEIIFDVIDNTFLTGEAGTYCWGNDESHFDNFKVSCLGIEVNLKAYLEGPFQSTEMTADLNTEAMIPLAQPYAGPPWNFTSLASVLAIPNPDVCDWVLIELRDAVDASSAMPSTIIGKKPGFILKDGSIVGLDGASPQRFRIDLQNQLFAVVYHRNHLPIMSAIPLTETEGIYTYDFTTNAGKAYAENQKDLGGGYFGLIAGNANADAIVNELDGIQVWNLLAGESGYLSSDANLDGQTDNPDKNDIWLSNYGQYEQLPGTGFVGCGTNLYDDRDGQYYATVQIGDQCWMAENLNIGNIINGTSNPSNNGIIEKYCINNNSSNCESNGGLYLWDELMEYSSVESSQGICPDGWHVPSNAEWCTMEQLLDPTVVCDNTGFRGTDIGTQLKQGGSSGFEALLTGERSFNGEFNYINFRGIYWTSTEVGFLATMRFVQSNDSRVYRWTTDEIYGFSVRCVLDDSK